MLQCIHVCVCLQNICAYEKIWTKKCLQLHAKILSSWNRNSVQPKKAKQRSPDKKNTNKNNKKTKKEQVKNKCMLRKKLLYNNNNTCT